MISRDQIESEGWRCTEDKMSTYPEGKGILVYVKDKYVILHVPDDNNMCIETDKDNTVRRRQIFEGTCKDINDFNIICKLIGV